MDPGTTYYYRAYIDNGVKETLGNLRKFKTKEAHDPNAWYAEMQSLGHGWWSSDWFGAFSRHTNDWIYHPELGWAHAVGDGADGVWLWLPDHRWVWTSGNAWPYLWKHDTASWLFLHFREGATGIFFDFRSNRYLEK